ncbi:MAG: tRNA threonylcarbamoyladenosine dehydratase [Lachnospiraceae bacterium]|nr:tRNA threonylcarbamoyladenosine dehydratase [Lachnospiraceae bacterium]
MQSEIFERTELLLGSDRVKTLSGKHVIVFGVGGVGGYVCEALARSGVGKLTIVDKDVVSISNINRQIIALHSTVGMPKVKVMEQRIKDINPDATVDAREMFFLPDTAAEFDFGTYDYVVDAVDTVTAKLTIITAAKNAGVPVISSMGAGNKLDPTKFVVADIAKTQICPLAKVMRRELRKRGIKGVKTVYSTEEAVEHEGTVIGSVAYVPSVAGLIIAGEVIKDLTGMD